MKKILLLSFIIFPIFCFSQEYSEVVQVKGKNADELYSKAREWFALSFNSANDVIQMQDEKNKKIIGKGIKSFQYIVNEIPSVINVHFTMVVETKDNRYKQSITNTGYSGIYGQELDFSELQKIATEEGLKELYEKMGVKPWVIGKKQFSKNLEANKKLIIEIEKETKNTLASLREFMSNEKENTEDW